MPTTNILSAVTDPDVLSRLSAVETAMPSPAASAPPAIADNSVKGALPAQFALADHTHQSQVRKIRMQTAADGTLEWAYTAGDGVTALPFASGVIPRIQCIAETTFGNTDVINAQIDGAPTNTSVKIRVTRTQRSVVALIGLTILSIPASPGVTWVHILASAP